jgi:hypothetical protein
MIEKLAAAELPPPGEGFEATKLTICPEANADPGTTTCKLVALTYFVCSAAPHWLFPGTTCFFGGLVRRSFLLLVGFRLG